MAQNRKKGKREKYGIDTIHLSFLTNLKGLKTFVSHLTPVVIQHDKALLKRTIKDLEKALKIVGIPKSDMKGRKVKKTKLKATQEQQNQFLSVIRKWLHVFSLPLHNFELLYKSTFVMLICYFDFLISDLIHYYYQVYPESLSGRELTMTLNDLNVCRDIGEARDYLVNKEVESILYKSLPDQRRYFVNQLKIDDKANIINWSKINEAVERRNVIVHNDSIINRRYLKNVDASLIYVIKENMKEGQKIDINEDYFSKVFDEIYLAGIILIQCCWRKWKKDEISSADTHLIDSVYNALLEERWAIAEKLGLFARECKVNNERNRLCLDINYCQSLKWQNKKDELESELKKFDVTSLKPVYVVALCALESNHDGFYKNLKQAILAGNLTKDDLVEWPLFREFREDPNYAQKVRRILRSARSAARR